MATLVSRNSDATIEIDLRQRMIVRRFSGRILRSIIGILSPWFEVVFSPFVRDCFERDYARASLVFFRNGLLVQNHMRESSAVVRLVYQPT